MAADIVPIQLGLTEGNVVTLWAPPWREDGEEWQAFLGHEENLYVFPTAAHLAAFIRTVDEHDLADHPEWETVATALAGELYPDLVAEPADLWTLAELADTVAILRALGEVCELDAITEVLDASDGFAMLGMGERAFAGRTGEKLWDEIGAVVSDKWDTVLDALDGVLAHPDVDGPELTAAQAELATVQMAVSAEDLEPDDEQDEGERDPDLAFWDEIGIDPIQVTVGGRTGWSLRCYLGDDPLLLSRQGKVLIFSSPERLETFLADESQQHSMTDLEVFADVRTGITDGEASVVAGRENTYVLDDVADGLRTGPGGVRRQQLALAVELLGDAAVERGDEETVEALGTSSPLGSLTSAIINPDPDRLAPQPPFDDEAAAFEVLTERFSGTLDWDATDRADAFETDD